MTGNGVYFIQLKTWWMSKSLGQGVGKSTGIDQLRFSVGKSIVKEYLNMIEDL